MSRFFNDKVGSRTRWIIRVAVTVAFFGALELTGSVTAQEWDCGVGREDMTYDPVKCVLDEDGTFTVSGEGTMRNYTSSERRPWHNSRANIKSVIIEEGVNSIGQGAFELCANLTSVEISNSVTNIRQNAFSMCTGLVSVTIPNNVTRIREYAFNGCTNLTYVISLNPTPPSLDDDVFRNVSVNLATLYVPESSIEAYSTYFDGSCSPEPRCRVWGGFGEVVYDPNYVVSIRHSTAHRNMSAHTPRVSHHGRTLIVHAPLSASSSYSVRLLDLRGKTVKRFRTGESGAGVFSLANVSVGSYLVEVRSGGKRVATSSVIVR